MSISSMWPLCHHTPSALFYFVRLGHEQPPRFGRFGHEQSQLEAVHAQGVKNDDAGQEKDDGFQEKAALLSSLPLSLKGVH